LTKEQILHIISEGEGQTVEFKKNFNNDMIIALAAFANSKGGSVLIGVDDIGKVKGVSVTSESIQSWVNEIKSKTVPSIIPNVEVFKFNSHNIVLFSISEFPVKPVAVRGRFYKRVQNSTHLMNANEISLLHLQSLQTSWDAYPYQDAKLDDLDFSKVSTFIERVNASERFLLDNNVTNALNKLSLVRTVFQRMRQCFFFQKRTWDITYI